MTIGGVNAMMPERDYLSLKSAGSATSKSPWLSCPLPEPALIRPLVSQKEKRQVLDPTGDGIDNMIGDTKPEMVNADADENEATMLSTFDKCEIVYRTLLHISWAKAVVDCTPGMHPPKNIEIPPPEIYDANLHFEMFRVHPGA